MRGTDQYSVCKRPLMVALWLASLSITIVETSHSIHFKEAPVLYPKDRRPQALMMYRRQK
jgi:hypothetical protein